MARSHRRLVRPSRLRTARLGLAWALNLLATPRSLTSSRAKTLAVVISPVAIAPIAIAIAAALATAPAQAAQAPVARGEAPPPIKITAEALTAPTRVVTLGTGTPNILPGRAGTATAVIVDEAEVYLFDAGAGFMETLSQFQTGDKAGLFPDSPSYPEFMYPTFLDKLFLTHLDSDHILGVPELLLRGWVLERSVPVRIWGPAGTATVVDGVVAAYQPDIQHRLGSLPIDKAAPYTGVVTELGSEPGPVFEDEYVRISAFDVPHGSWGPGHAFGYRIEAPDKTIVISGDTRFSDNLIEHAQGADILLHEVMSEQGLKTLPEDWQEYMLGAHTSPTQLADIADQVDPALLVMIHPLLLGASEETLMDEMSTAYDGVVELAQDGDVFE